MLPDGATILFVLFREGKGSIVAFPLKGGKPTTVIAGADARYLSSTGHLVYLSEGHLVGARFNTTTLRIEGEPVALERDVSSQGAREVPWLTGTFDISTTGTLAYVTGPREGLVWKTRTGAETRVPLPLPGSVYYLSLAPDGGRAALTVQGTGGPRLWMATLDEGDPDLTPITDQNDWFGTFTCDGRRLLFSRQLSPGEVGIFSLPIERSREIQPQTRAVKGAVQKASSFGCPGDTFLFNHIVGDTEGDIWQQELDKPETARLVVAGAKKQIEGSFSPDRHWIAYTSDSSGRNEIYVEGYPTGPTTMVSTDGGTEPVWHPRGGELFYQFAGTVFSVHVANGRRVGRPSIVLRTGREGLWNRPWDIAPDGDRFLVAQLVRQPYINVVVNWFEELTAKLTTR
jgi:hypothetical protein